LAVTFVRLTVSKGHQLSLVHFTQAMFNIYNSSLAQFFGGWYSCAGGLHGQQTAMWSGPETIQVHTWIEIQCNFHSPAPIEPTTAL
jgi:hypothetical protein